MLRIPGVTVIQREGKLMLKRIAFAVTSGFTVEVRKPLGVADCAAARRRVQPFGMAATLSTLTLFAFILLLVHPAEAFAASWSEWGAWSGWQDSAVSASDSRQVETRLVTRYDLHSDTCGDASNTRCYLKYVMAGYSPRASIDLNGISQETLDSSLKCPEGSWYLFADNVNGRIVGPGMAYAGAWSDWRPVFIVNSYLVRQYRYRTRVAMSGRAQKVITVGDYVVQSKTGSRVLDVNSASSADGANIHIWAKSGALSQTFTIEKGGVSGSYRMKNKNSGKVIDTAGNVVGSANVQQWTAASDNRGQSWLFEDAGGGYVYIRNLWGYYLDVAGGTDANGTNVQTWEFNGSDAQKWKLVSTDKTAFMNGKLTPPGTKTYTGKRIKPDVKLVIGKTTLKAGKHYKLTYKNNLEVGKATVTVTGLGKYKGAVRTCTFKIIPKPTKIKSLKASATGVSARATWAKCKAGRCSGYQLRYSTSNSMASAKRKLVVGRNSVSATIGGLTSNKTYRVQARVYAKVNGVSYYSSWSKVKSVKLSACGSVDGMVTSASTGSALKGVSVTAYTSGGERVCKTSSAADGKYRIPSLVAGSYRLKIAKSGYQSLTVPITVRANKVTHCENALLVKGKGKVTASGTISNAITGKGVENVTLKFKKGWNNANGAVAARSTTGPAGRYKLKLKCGYYTVVATCPGYVKTSFNISVERGKSSNLNGVINPIGNKSTTWRAVLTWGKNPRDLDSHLVSTGSGGGYHVYFRNKLANLGASKAAELDVDDITSYGPETVTFKVKKNRTYDYYVYLYNGIGSLQRSSATVRLYQGNTLVGTYAVPSSGSASNLFWNVFSIRNGKVTERQTITSYPVGVSSGYANEGTHPGPRTASTSGSELQIAAVPVLEG